MTSRDLGRLRGHRADDEQQRIDLRLRGDHVERLGQLRQRFRPKGGGRREVERIGGGRHRDEQRPQPLDTLGAERRRAQSPCCAHWSAPSTPLPPPKVTMPTPRAGGQPAVIADQHQRHVDQLLDRVDADHAQLLQDRVEHAVLADQRAGVRLRRARGRSGSRPALISTTGLPRRRASSSARTSFAPSLHAFEVAADDSVPSSRAKRMEVVGEVDDGLVAAADQVAEAEAGLAAPSRTRSCAMPPLWLTIEITPGAQRVDLVQRGREGRRSTGSAALMTPTQLGPHSAKPGLAAQARRARAAARRPRRRPRRDRPHRRCRGARRRPRTRGSHRSRPSAGMARMASSGRSRKLGDARRSTAGRRPCRRCG